MTSPESVSQKQAFLFSEGDAYFSRNRDSHSKAFADPWNAEIARYIKPGSSILEIGCSDGRRLAAIERKVNGGCTMSGVDPSAQAIQSGKAMNPEFDLRVGTSDDTGFRDPFDVIIFGFCLYLCDREKLLMSVAHVDQLLRPGGLLCFIDFDPVFPSKRQYAHLEGIWSYKMDYPSIFLALPNYTLEYKNARHGPSLDTPIEELPDGDRVALTVLRKRTDDGYVLA